MLSAYDLDIYDRCERRYAYERDWESLILSPMGLLYRAFEGALSADIPEETAKSIAIKTIGTMELRTTALEPYTVAVHMGALAGILATYIRAKLGPLMPSPVSTSPDGYEWRPGTFEDASGLRHRFVLVDHWDDDRLSSEAHSWATIGELAATGRPLTLHALVVGPNRSGRRHSPWTKGLLHPVNRSLRFGKRQNRGKANGLNGGWTEVWREVSNVGVQEWLRTMQEDGVLADLVVSRPIKLDSSDRRLVAARAEIVQISQAGLAGASAQSPMRRSSCDEVGRGPCPFQHLCYSPVEITPEELPNLYRRRGVDGESGDPQSKCRPANPKMTAGKCQTAGNNR